MVKVGVMNTSFTVFNKFKEMFLCIH